MAARGRVQKWQPWANEFGLNATYTLISYRTCTTRLKPRTEDRSRLATSKARRRNQSVPARELGQLADSHALVQDRRFGSANFMPLADGAVYKVVITQSGFNAEPVNDAAAKANEARDNGL